jgi:hypothetical protein
MFKWRSSLAHHVKTRHKASGALASAINKSPPSVATTMVQLANGVVAGSNTIDCNSARAIIYTAVESPNGSGTSSKDDDVTPIRQAPTRLLTASLNEHLPMSPSACAPSNGNSRQQLAIQAMQAMQSMHGMIPQGQSQNSQAEQANVGFGLNR